MKLEDKYSTSECKKLRDRMKRKERNAIDRGIEYDLTEDDWYMFGEKLLGMGFCDYTGDPFTMISTSGRYPTLERIDQKKGYVRGNIAIVAQRANKMKDFFVDRTFAKLEEDNIVSLRRRDGIWLAPLFVSTQHEKLEELKLKYIPKGEDMTQQAAEVEEKIVLVEAQAALAEPEATEAPVEAVEKIEPKATQSPELPPDVRLAAAYGRWAKAYSGIGLEFKLSFAQFKAAYAVKLCAFTREKIPEADKVMLLLDRSKPVEAGNVVVTTERFAAALNTVLDLTGGSVSTLAKAVKKFA